ncbi:hypothetical protein CPAR01_01489 [Colletotrichum paranaense]|uniref:tetrahydrofolate synthase n=1 Tax=Colletotrichum paranaense TaxID=1914294 RepID=A0ABQ9T860_9PEZI|nr:uncharacterized protein CPAR01_01489 [Colletotrichum paranaense]KAK1547522.1 hypothetical protein CPAR01_01489 [Colletotrichum paranaense]
MSPPATPPSSRTYTDAINLLNTLIPNLKVHALFNKPKDAAPTTAAPATPTADPNLLAIPEMRAWLLRANLTPERLSSLSFIHIAGTKGKGSVTALTTSALLNHSSSSSSPPSTTHIGPIGTYTSPHLLTPRERIAISNTPISQTLFATSFFELWDTLSSCTSPSAPGGSASSTGPDLGIEPGSKPFYFRFLTLLALHVFLKLRVRTVVLECGIGGEYDATNAIPAEAVTTSVITQLGIDHVAMLGSTPSQIAWHKAGVMKPGVATFTRRLSDEVHPGVMTTLRSRAREVGAELIEVDDEDVIAWSGVKDAKLPGGDFQKRNQALAALAARRHIQVLQAREAGSSTVGKANRSLADVPGVIIAGLREATLRGRHELLRQGGVSWYLDGAHNADSLAEVARWISPIVTATTSSDTTHNDGESFVLVFNQQERDASALLTEFLRQMKTLGVDPETRLAAAIFTRNDKTNIAGEGGEVDLSVQEACAAAFRELYPATKVMVCRDLTEMKSAVDGVAEPSSGTNVLVTGSMYLVGNVIGFLEPENLFIRALQDAQRATNKMQTARDKSLYTLALRQALANAPDVVQGLLDGRYHAHVGVGIQLGPALRKLPLHRHGLDGFGVVLVVDETIRRMRPVNVPRNSALLLHLTPPPPNNPLQPLHKRRRQPLRVPPELGIDPLQRSLRKPHRQTRIPFLENCIRTDLDALKPRINTNNLHLDPLLPRPLLQHPRRPSNLLNRKPLTPSLHNPALMPRNLLHRIPQRKNVIDPQRRNPRRDRPSHKIRSIILPSDPRLQNSNIAPLAQESMETNQRQIPRIYRPRPHRNNLFQHLILLPQPIPHLEEIPRKQRLGYRHAVNPYPLPNRNQMRRDQQPNLARYRPWRSGAVPCEDGVGKGAGASFPLCPRDVNHVEAVEVGDGVAHAREVRSHFGDGGFVGADACLAAGFDYREGGLEGVERVDGVLGLD